MWGVIWYVVTIEDALQIPPDHIESSIIHNPPYIQFTPANIRVSAIKPPLHDSVLLHVKLS